MGRKAKQRHSLERKKRKAEDKAAKKALYESYAQKGKERKRQTSGSSGKGWVKHPQTPCGNPACKRCYQLGERIKQDLAPIFPAISDS